MKSFRHWTPFVIALLSVFPSLFGAETAVVLRPTANLHALPSPDAEVVSQAIYGSNLEVLEDRANWSRVRTADEYTGWVHKALLSRSDHPYAAAGRVAKVSSLFASLYREASLSKHQPITSVPFETRLEVIGDTTVEGEPWLQVRLPDQRLAWLLSGDTNLNPESLNVHDMVDLSRKFLGLSYLWGGTSTYGFDCSGFTQMLLRQRGLIMPRDAAPQAAWTGATKVERTALRPGDLLFFGISDSKITHTGMYIGNGEFINATRHLKPQVQICKLSDPHWSKIYVTARRVK